VNKHFGGHSFHDEFTVGGIDSLLWFDAFEQCHNETAEGYQRIAWPDGKSYLDQDNLVVEMFNRIKSELIRMRMERGKKRH
jgi:hypothetical protein